MRYEWNVLRDWQLLLLKWFLLSQPTYRSHLSSALKSCGTQTSRFVTASKAVTPVKRKSGHLFVRRCARCSPLQWPRPSALAIAVALRAQTFTCAVRRSTL